MRSHVKGKNNFGSAAREGAPRPFDRDNSKWDNFRQKIMSHGDVIFGIWTFINQILLVLFYLEDTYMAYFIYAGTFGTGFWLFMIGVITLKVTCQRDASEIHV